MKNIKLTKADKKLFKSLRKYLKCRVEQKTWTFKIKKTENCYETIDWYSVDDEILKLIYSSNFIEKLDESIGMKPVIALVNSNKAPKSNAFEKYFIIRMTDVHASSSEISLDIMNSETKEIKNIRIKTDDLIYAFIRKLENDIIAGIKPTVKNSFTITRTI